MIFSAILIIHGHCHMFYNNQYSINVCIIDWSGKIIAKTDDVI